MTAESVLWGLPEPGFYPNNAGNGIISDDITWSFLTEGLYTTAVLNQQGQAD